MADYTGSCHCGAIRFAFSANPIDSAMRCDCSMCRRKGAVLSTFTLAPEEIEIVAQPEAQRIYQFGTMTARHHFCGTCGIHTFVETRLRPGQYRINLGCVEGLDPFELPETPFDGMSL